MTRLHLAFALFGLSAAVILAAATGLAGWWAMPPGANALAIPMIMICNLAERLRRPEPLDRGAQWIVAALFGLGAAFSVKAAFDPGVPVTVLAGVLAALAYTGLVTLGAKLPAPTPTPAPPHPSP